MSNQNLSPYPPPDNNPDLIRLTELFTLVETTTQTVTYIIAGKHQQQSTSYRVTVMLDDVQISHTSKTLQKASHLVLSEVIRRVDDNPTRFSVVANKLQLKGI